MIFPYRLRPIAPTKLVVGDVVYRPLVPLQVWGVPFEFIGVWALADTGADQTLLPHSLAEPLGISFKRGASRVRAFGGQTPTVQPGYVELRLGDDRQRFEWIAAAGFVRFTRPEDEIVVLGHTGCLEYFRLTFDGERKEIEFVPTPQFLGSIATQIS